MEEKIFNEDFLNRLNKINLQLKVKLSNGTSGARKSKAKGISAEFSDFREYSSGDDIRKVDWNAYGRTNKLFLKVFMEERQGTFNIFIDKSKSMDYGENNKKSISLKIAAALSYIVLNNLDKVNINIVGEDDIKSVSGNNSKKSFQLILKKLEQIEFKGVTKLADLIKNVKLSASGGSILISDFFAENIEDAIKYLAYKKQQILLIRVLSEEELNPQQKDEVTFIDSETKERIKLNLNSKIIEEYKKRLNKQNKELEDLVSKYGGSFICVNSSKPIEEIILKQFASKRVIF